MNMLVILGMIGPWQIGIIVVVIVLLFGGRKIPELMKGIGQGMTEFKKATKKDNDESDEAKSDGPDNDLTAKKEKKED